MENFQFDVIDLPNKKVEYISQGLQAFAQGIAGGMTTYAKNLNDKAKERQEKQNALPLHRTLGWVIVPAWNL